jgi:hypothetical protein
VPGSFTTKNCSLLTLFLFCTHGAATASTTVLEVASIFPKRMLNKDDGGQTREEAGIETSRTGIKPQKKENEQKSER